MEHAGRLALAILAVEMGVDKRVIVHVFIPLSCPDQMGRRLMDIGAQQPLEGYMYLSKKAQGTSHNSVALRFTKARLLSMGQRDLFVIDGGDCWRSCDESHKLNRQP
jgi:hypothetical protein